jgi:heme biosynthesis protein (nirJ-2)
MSKYYYINPIFQMAKINPNYVILYAFRELKLLPIAQINNSAFDILYLCNGKNDKESIIQKLSLTYSNVNSIDKAIVDYIESCVKNKMLLTSSKPLNVKHIKVIGTKETWSPELITIELTNSCLLRCKHCYKNAGSKNLHYLSYMKIKDVIDELPSIFTKQIQLTGGEPFLHPDIFNIIDYCLKNNLLIHISTSGYIPEEIKNKLKKYNPKHFSIQVSIDGLQSYHNTFRGRKNAFEKTIDFIKDLITCGFSIVVALTISTQEKAEIIKLADFLKEIGVSVLRIGAIIDKGRASDNHISSDEKTFIKIDELVHYLSEVFDCESFHVQYMENTNNNSQSRNCGLGQEMLKISEKGIVSPCIMSDIKLGNINYSNIDSILKRYAPIFSQITPPNSENCGSCEKLFICKGCIVNGIENGNHNCSWYFKNKQWLEQLTYGN